MADELEDHPRILRINELTAEFRKGADEFSRLLQQHERSGRNEPTAEHRQQLKALNDLHLRIKAEIKGLQDDFGIPEELIRLLEKQEMPLLEDRYWKREVEAVTPTGHFDDLAGAALERLLPGVDADWLAQEGARRFRLGDAFLHEPLHLWAGTQVHSPDTRPHRFADMLLVTQDHLVKRAELDFFAAPMFLAEVTMLGRALDAIPDMGPAAEEKFASLPTLPNDEVASTVHELLVGSACAHHGVKVEMLAAPRNQKSPDFRIAEFHIPAGIECKRRLRPTAYEEREASHVFGLYQWIEPLLDRRGVHSAIEASFSSEVFNLSADEFANDVEGLLTGTPEGDERTCAWGSLRYERLPHVMDVPRTRLYAPNYLERVFGWTVDQDAWDGMVCHVDTPNQVLVHAARNPRCLKWVSRSEKAAVKKARGVTSLWADATRQIPAGWLGFIYIAYPESSRASVADARTRFIMDSSSKWFHRWTVIIPMSIIGWLYPRALGVGMPDLIESCLPITAEGEEDYLRILPSQVFTLKQ
jgi:hypothetical protein